MDERWPQHSDDVRIDTRCANEQSPKQVAASLSGQDPALELGTLQVDVGALRAASKRNAREGQTGSAQPSNLPVLASTGRKGIPLKPENVRKVWERVVRDRLALARSTPARHIDPSGSVSAPSPSLPHLLSRARCV